MNIFFKNIFQLANKAVHNLLDSISGGSIKRTVYEQFSTFRNYDILSGMIHGICRHGLYNAHYFHSFQNLAKDSMFTIQPGGFDASNEELGAIGVWSWRKKRVKFLNLFKKHS